MFRQVVAQFNQIQVRDPLAHQVIPRQPQVLILLINKIILTMMAIIIVMTVQHLAMEQMIQTQGTMATVQVNN